jgi:hypothetical protein
MMRFLTILLMLAAAVSAADWPGFRGGAAQGVSEERGIPVEFGPAKHLAWKTAIAGEGWSSPVVWQGTVFLTTATEQGASCRAVAVEAASGKVRWDVEIARQATKQKEKKNSYASPTPVTDGKAVYCVCGGGTFAALDFQGRLLWKNEGYPHYSQHGLGSSPVLVGDLLIQARDGSAETGDLKLGWQKPWDQGYLVALDKRTGKERWKTGRGSSRIAHVTPALLGGTLVSGAGDVVQGFDPASGKLLWSGASQGEGVVPSIVVGEGLIFTVSGFEKPTIRAFRPGGSMAWEQTKGVPMIPSLLYRDGLLYAVTTNGIAQCMRAASGEIVWQHRIGGNFSASPVWVEGRLYFISEEGVATVMKAGPTAEVLAANELSEMAQASPAVSGGRLFVRTAGHLWCFRQ